MVTHSLSGALAARIALVAGLRSVRIRPIRPSDADLLSEGFSRLSVRSRRMRFHSSKARLSAEELRYFTDVDHHDHEALVAVSRIDGTGLGVARYVRRRDDPQAAEVAVTIIDEWQGRGLGTRLATRLIARARCEGIRRFIAVVSTDNRGARRLLTGVGGRPTLVDRDGEVLTYDVALPQVRPEPVSSRRQLLGAAAGCTDA